MTSFTAPSAIDPDSGVGFGCMGITAFYGDAMPDNAAIELLQGVYDAGCRHFDTAEIYKTGNPFADSDADIYNETVVGKFLVKVPRDSFTVATKYMPFKFDGSCEYEAVKKSLTASLTRLGLDYVDMYYCHRVPSKEAALQFAESAKKLMEEGLIKACGISEICSAWLRDAHAVCPVTAVQQEWSLLTRNAEDDLIPCCAELGITVVCYSPLARNLLATKVDKPPTDWRATLPRYTEEALATNAALYAEVEALAKAKDSSAAALSLAWLFHRAKAMGVRAVPIPGTTKLTHAQSNISAAQLTLTDEEVSTLETLADRVAGARGDEQYVSIGIEAQK